MVGSLFRALKFTLVHLHCQSRMSCSALVLRRLSAITVLNAGLNRTHEFQSGHCHRGQQCHFTLSYNQSTGYSIIVFTVHIDRCTIGLLRGSIICTIRFDLTRSGCHRHRVIFTSCRLFNCSNQSLILSAISS